MELDLGNETAVQVTLEAQAVVQRDRTAVNDVKSGPSGKGGVALWIGPGTVAHFRNLVVTQ